ncbi:unnamed protein product [Peniophora sp. CBMAI 1063]|nr:unnamed protein product [Peniophora sp. CBMAI 1063]
MHDQSYIVQPVSATQAGGRYLTTASSPSSSYAFTFRSSSDVSRMPMDSPPAPLVAQQDAGVLSFYTVSSSTSTSGPSSIPRTIPSSSQSYGAELVNWPPAEFTAGVTSLKRSRDYDAADDPVDRKRARPGEPLSEFEKNLFSEMLEEQHRQSMDILAA